MHVDAKDVLALLDEVNEARSTSRHHRISDTTKPMGWMVFEPKGSEFDYKVYADEAQANSRATELSDDGGHEEEVIPLYAKEDLPRLAEEAADFTAPPFRVCKFCGCNTNARIRACCDKGRAVDKGDLIEVTVEVNGVSGYAYVEKMHERHVCGSHGFGLGPDDVCYRCQADREAAHDARRRADFSSLKDA